MIRLLFVCIENSARSQMAQGLAQFLAKRYKLPELEAYSAGSHPSGRVNPLAIAAMKEAGIDISGHQSKGLSEIPDFEYDYVITMGCGDSCPFVRAKNRLDWQIENPAGKDLEGFKKIRDQVEENVDKLLRSLV